MTNSKFRFLIVFGYEGIVSGTNDSKVALEHSCCDENIIIDLEANQVLLDEKYTDEIDDIEEE